VGVGDVGSEEIMLGDGVESSVSSSDKQAVQLSRHLDVGGLGGLAHWPLAGQDIYSEVCICYLGPSL